MTLFDKKGCSFELRSCKPDDYSYVEEMYDSFTPKARFQGLPPSDKEVCQKWIKGLLEVGENFLAWQEVKVVGHSAILPDFNKGNAEYLIFVSQTNRCRGVGKELTRVAIQRAKDLGIKIVWLTVDAYNFRAVKLYKKFGFEFCEQYSSATERMMALNLGHDCLFEHMEHTHF